MEAAVAECQNQCSFPSSMMEAEEAAVVDWNHFQNSATFVDVVSAVASISAVKAVEAAAAGQLNHYCLCLPSLMIAKALKKLAIVLS